MSPPSWNLQQSGGSELLELDINSDSSDLLQGDIVLNLQWNWEEW